MLINKKHGIITVWYVGVFATLTNKKSEKLSFNQDITLYELLSLLSRKYGKEFYNELFEGEKLRASLLLLVNGVRVEPSHAENLMLKAEDSVVISPLLAIGG